MLSTLRTPGDAGRFPPAPGNTQMVQIRVSSTFKFYSVEITHGWGQSARYAAIIMMVLRHLSPTYNGRYSTNHGRYICSRHINPVAAKLHGYWQERRIHVAFEKAIKRQHMSKLAFS